jgi:hypothetical protein
MWIRGERLPQMYLATRDLVEGGSRNRVKTTYKTLLVSAWIASCLYYRRPTRTLIEGNDQEETAK